MPFAFLQKVATFATFHVMQDFGLSLTFHDLTVPSLQGFCLPVIHMDALLRWHVGSQWDAITFLTKGPYGTSKD